MKTKPGFQSSLHYYYAKNPGTLRPLLMAALATHGYLHRTTTQRKPHESIFSLHIPEALTFDWVQLNDQLHDQFQQLQAEGYQYLNIEMELPTGLRHAWEVIQQYDDVTIQQQHHRQGMLDNHSYNKVSEKAQRQYAGILLAEALLSYPKSTLRIYFIHFANQILEYSNVQPPRHRLQVSETLVQLLQYDGKGTVYNPFSGTGLAAAMLQAGKHLYADGSPDHSDFVAAYLINYGAGGSNDHFIQRDSKQWIHWLTPDYVVCTYLGYIGNQTAFDFCLSHCLQTFQGHGKMAATISPYALFDHMSTEVKTALRRNWIDTILLLPFGEVALLIDASRTPTPRATLRFIDTTNPILSGRPINEILANPTFAQNLSVTKVARPGYLRALIAPEIHEREGYEIVELRDLVKPIPRKVYNLKPGSKNNTLITLEYITFDLSYGYTESIRNPIKELFDPAYHLTKQSLLVSRRGKPTPTIFEPSDQVDAYFVDGYAFELIYPSTDNQWIINELNEEYVARQLHPFGYDSMVPPPFTAEQILSLKIYQKVQTDEDSFYDDEHSTITLPVNAQFTNEDLQYTILRELGNGGYGVTYLTREDNLHTGASRTVVLKEYLPQDWCHREGLRVVLDWDEDAWNEALQKFKKEAELLITLSKIPDSHIMNVETYFESEETGTSYYIMQPYLKGSLDDMICCDQVPSETIIIDHIVKPLCHALQIIHSHGILHLDIKPANILIDDNGDATLIDFGMVKKYKEDGEEQNRESVGGTRVFSAPEHLYGQLTSFEPQADIYSLAGTLYSLFTNRVPSPIWENDKISRNCISDNLTQVSAPMRQAIIRGLQASANLRPASAEEFLQIVTSA